MGSPMDLSRVLLAALLLPAAAHAQTQPDPNTGTGTGANGLTKADFTIELRQKVGNEYRRFNETEADTFFNRARCLCDESVRIDVRLTPAGVAKARTIRRADVKLMAGDQTCVCTGAACATVRCQQIDTTRDLNSLITTGLAFDTTVRAVFQGGRATTGGSDTSACNRDEMQTLWVWMDVADDSNADTVLTDVNYAIKLDGVPPATPTGLTVIPGNEALQVSWTALPYLDDLQGYIVFCARNGDLPVFPGAHSPVYSTPALCAGTTSALTAEDDSSTPMHGSAPDKIRALDPQFACSDIITAAKPEVRLYQLQNGIPYVVGVSSVDKRGNASPIEEVVVQAPIPTRDFYRSYRDAGGTAEGGFCAVAARAAAPRYGVALLLIAPLIALFARRRRR
jgi:hypothetical protein